MNPFSPARVPRPARSIAWLAAFLLALAAALPAQAATRALLVVGDSISAGYGLPNGAGWTHLLGARLAEQHYPYQVVNASITGDTTAGGRARLPALLSQHRPAVVVIELGGNDGLRGGDLGAMRSNLDAMIRACLAAGARVLLVGMQMPPNYGPYARQFAQVYRDVADKMHVPLVPFLFQGFAETDAWFQPDRIHPTVAAQPRLLDNVWPALKPILDRSR